MKACTFLVGSRFRVAANRGWSSSKGERRGMVVTHPRKKEEKNTGLACEGKSGARGFLDGDRDSLNCDWSLGLSLPQVTLHLPSDAGAMGTGRPPVVRVGYPRDCQVWRAIRRLDPTLHAQQ